MYTELSYVNAALASMGEAPVLALDVPHPYVPQAVALLARFNKLVQSKRWWFNTTVVTLVPVAPTYTVAASLPSGALSIIGLQGNAYVLNADGTVYDIQRGEQVTSDIEVLVLREVAFESLPVEANIHVADCALLQFQISYDADPARTQMLATNKRDSWIQLHAQNIRLTKTNILRTPGMQSKLLDARGDRPMLRGAE